MSADQSQEIWQVESGGQIFETNFAELTTWINESSLLRIDRVRKGNLRWIEAGKVPSLVAVFNAKESREPLPPPVITLTHLGPASFPGDSAANPPNYTSSPAMANLSEQADRSTSEPVCSMHADVPAAFNCDTCGNQFCKACPNSYGGTVKICPFCGAMCKPLPKVEKVQTNIYYPEVGVFGVADFMAALAYPFKFKASLIMGAIMFMFLSLGQSVVSFGGIFMMWGAIACFMLANTLTFGILANTVENFSQGKLGLNFMPSFDDFSLWDDVVHPVFLMIGVYISSFGPLMAVAILGFFLIVTPVQKELNGMREDAARTVSPGLPYAANAARQSEKVRELLNKNANQQLKRVESMESGIIPPDDLADTETLKTPGQLEDEHIQSLDRMIQESRKSQLESVVGKAPDTQANEQAAMIKQVLGYGAVLLILGGLCLLWGFFYYPAACAVAAYTRSFGATLNPTVGFDTIRRLGLDYVKILLMGLCLAIASGVIGGVLSVLLSPLNLPRVGNLPATAIGSLFGFYFSVVFACVIGFALYKAAERLKLYR